MTVRLDRMQRGLVEALSGVASTVSWAMGEAPRDTADLLSLRLRAGPSPLHRQHAHERLVDAAELVDVQVTGAVLNDRAVLELNDFPYIVDVVDAGATPTDIRDAFVTTVTEQDGETITVTAVDTDRLQLTPITGGAIRSVKLSGPLSTTTVTLGEPVAITEGTSTMVVEVSAYSLDRTPRGGAHSILGEVLARLTRPDVVEKLGRWGVSIYDRGVVTDLSAIAGGHWESRALLELTIAMRSTVVSSVPFIESVGLDIVIDDEIAATVAVP